MPDEIRDAIADMVSRALDAGCGRGQILGEVEYQIDTQKEDDG